VRRPLNTVNSGPSLPIGKVTGAGRRANEHNRLRAGNRGWCRGPGLILSRVMIEAGLATGRGGLGMILAAVPVRAPCGPKSLWGWSKSKPGRKSRGALGAKCATRIPEPAVVPRTKKSLRSKDKDAWVAWFSSRAISVSSAPAAIRQRDQQA